MPPKSCRVLLTDGAGIDHRVEALADSLYEAAALGLALLRKTARVSKEPGPLTRLRVEVREPAAEHSLTIPAVEAVG